MCGTKMYLSATTLKPLTVNNIDHLTTVQYFAGTQPPARRKVCAATPRKLLRNCWWDLTKSLECGPELQDKR